MHEVVFVIHHIEDEIDWVMYPYGEESDEFKTFHNETEEATRRYNELDEETRKKFPTLRDFALDYGYTEEDGRYGWYFNNNAMYDWYSVGGRWSGVMKDKSGNESDELPLEEIDLAVEFPIGRMLVPDNGWVDTDWEGLKAYVEEYIGKGKGEYFGTIVDIHY